MNTKSFMIAYRQKINGLFQRTLEEKVFSTEWRLTYLKVNLN
ncbi:hypothetical protein [Tenacibaculum sp. 190524A02b]